LLADTKEQYKRKPAHQGVRQLSSKSLRRRISAKSAIVLDSVTGSTLYSHSPDLPGQPASTIKVLTGLISIESLQDDELVSVSRRAARMPRSKIWLDTKKKYPANDLVNAVLLASANDASVALAEKIAGTEKGFAQIMTAKARSLGAKNTICKTASGLTSRGQKSTARDLANIFNSAMKNRYFAKKMARTKVRTVEGKVLRSHNKALWQVDGAEGGKTGYTNVARQTYVGKFKRDCGEITVAILGSETMWVDIKNLVEYGFKKQQYNRQLALTNKKDTAPVKLVTLDNADRNIDDSPLIITSISKRPSL